MVYMEERFLMFLFTFFFFISSSSSSSLYMLQDEILPWFEKPKNQKTKRKLPLRVLNSKWKISRPRIGSAQNFRLR